MDQRDVKAGVMYVGWGDVPFQNTIHQNIQEHNRHLCKVIDFFFFFFAEFQAEKEKGQKT